MSGTNDLYHGKLPMQMYALEAASGTNELYHSWAGLVATMNKFHGAPQDSSTCLPNNLGKAHALPEGEEHCIAHLLYKTNTLTLVGLRTSNNKTINVWLLV